jgi:hypothetical protein
MYVFLYTRLAVLWFLYYMHYLKTFLAIRQKLIYFDCLFCNVAHILMIMYVHIQLTIVNHDRNM